MKKRMGLLLSMSLATVLVACGDKEEVTNTDTNTANDTHQFREFSLDVDYSPTESYEASYDADEKVIEASIEDERTKELIEGDEAYKKLAPLFEELTFDQTSSNDEVLAQIKKVFDVSTPFDKLELDVTFSDGTKKEYIEQ